MTADTAFSPLVVPRLGEAPVDLRGEADRARARGYADGFAEGRRRALDESRQQQAVDRERMLGRQDDEHRRRLSALDALETAGAALERRTARLSDAAADRIEELAVDLAAAILRAELSEPGRSAAHAVRRALAAMPVVRWTRVVLSPEDAATLRDDPDVAETLGSIEIATSTDVDAGGAIVEIDAGAVDTRIGRALERAVAALNGARGDSGEVPS